MSSTNHTENFNFPQWVGSDYPSFINDLNPAFLTIDTKLKSNETAVAFAGKVNNAIPKNNVLAEYFDHKEN